MLVYCKNPRGVLYLGHYQIWGKETGQGPREIPWEIYHACRDGLEDATMREGYLSKKFGKQFPPVAFTYSELRWVADKTLDIVGSRIIEEYDPSWSRKKKVDWIKKRIARVSKTD